MRIDVRHAAGKPGHRLGEETEIQGLLRELSARGFEAVPARPSGAPPSAAGVAQDPRRDPEVREHAPEALLLAGSTVPADGALLSGWRDAALDAARAGRPVVLTGLALGGDEPDPVLGDLLCAASLVGLRDEASLAAARQLCPGHPALHAGWEDALLLLSPATQPRRPEGAARAVGVFGRPAGPFRPEDAASVLAALLDALAHRTGGEVVVVARSDAAEDQQFCAAVAARLPADVRCSVVGRPDDELVVSAEHVVTTCRSAAALALAATVDVLPVATDSYAERGMQGLLDRWGLVDSVVPLAALLTPGDVAWDTRAAAQQWASEAVQHRAAVRAVLAGSAPVVGEAAARWWDAVAGALRGEPLPALPESHVAPRGVGAPVARSLRRRYTVPAAPPPRPTVAVVVRTGNRAAALGPVLDGILGQTFMDWRLVVVHDGGDPAGTDALVAERHDRLAGRGTVLHHRRGFGPGAAANRGLRAADSELVVLLDSGLAPDGPWPATLLQQAVAHLEDPLVEDDGVVVGVRAPGRGTAEPGPEAVTLTGLLGGGPAMPGPFVYRRAVHGVLGDYDESLAGPGQWEFGLRFLETFTVGLVSGRAFAPRAARAGDDPAQARRRDELVVRERHLKRWTAEHGIGLPLHLGRALGEQTGALHRRLDASEALTRELLDVVRAQSVQLERLERSVSERGVAAFWRRVWQALVRR